MQQTVTASKQLFWLIYMHRLAELQEVSGWDGISQHSGDIWSMVVLQMKLCVILLQSFKNATSNIEPLHVSWDTPWWEVF